MSLLSALDFGERKSKSLERTVARKLNREYTTALQGIRSTLGKYYEKYDMTWAEMQKYGRLKSLEEELNNHLNALSTENGRTIRTGVSDIYRESYYTTAYGMEKEIQAKLRYTMLDPQTVRASVQNPISGLTLNDRLRNRRREITTRIRSEVTQGLMRGDGYQDMARHIREGLNIELNKATAIARTEAHRCQVQGRRASLEHAEDMGVQGVYVWDSAIDDRTRYKHRKMDGQEADKDGMFTTPDGYRGKGPGLMGAPHHDINCRCSVRYQIKGFAPEKRRVRGEGVIPYETYAEYKKERIGA